MSEIRVIVIINWQLQVATPRSVGDGPSLQTLPIPEAQSNGLTKKQIRASAKPKPQQRHPSAAQGRCTVLTR